MTYLSHWDEYGIEHRDWSCTNAEEHCSNCGRRLMESIEPTGLRSRKTGEPTFARYHSCPTGGEDFITEHGLAACPAPAGLDVERLRTALDNLYDEKWTHADEGPRPPTTVFMAYAEDIAREYAALASPDSERPA